jgi:hypothetical protein
MKKWLPLLFVAACSDPQPTPPATPTRAAPASAPVAAASQPASVPVEKAETVTLLDSGPRVLAVEGEATVDGKKAVVGMEVKATSVLETQQASKLTFTLKPGSVIQVRQNAKVELGNSERKTYSLKLLAGAIWSFLPKATSYEVVGANVVAGVRGTVFYVENMADDKTYVCDCDGEVETVSGKKKKLMKSKQQHKGMIAHAAKMKDEKKAINHTKEEAAELMKLMSDK